MSAVVTAAGETLHSSAHSASFVAGLSLRLRLDSQYTIKRKGAKKNISRDQVIKDSSDS